MLELKTVLWIPFSYGSKDKWCQVRHETCGGEKKKILALRSAIIEETTVPRITLSVVLILPTLCDIYIFLDFSHGVLKQCFICRLGLKNEDIYSTYRGWPCIICSGIPDLEAVIKLEV